MDPTTLRVEAEGPLLRVTLVQTGIGAQLLADLNAALDQAEADPACRLVLIQGRDGTFCAGMDFDEATRAGTGASPEEGGRAFLGVMRRFTTVPRVVVSVVDGRAVGGGVGLAAASDFVFATDRSQFSLPEALWGLLPCCVLPFLMRRTGFQKAYTMTLSTQPISAREAERVQLVDEVADDPEQAARRLLPRLSRLRPETLGDAKRYADRIWPLTTATQSEALTEFVRLMNAPAVRRNLAAYANHGKFPWET